MGDIESKAFAMIPLGVFADKRLTLEQHRVMGALCSFRGSSNDFEVQPKRAAIAVRCGMAECKVSEATSALEALGWIVKNGSGGHSKACRYLINNKPISSKSDADTVTDSGTVTREDTVTDSVMVQSADTVTDSGTGGVTYSVTGMRVTDSVTGKEEKINKEESEREQVPLPSAGKKGKRKSTNEITFDEFISRCRDENVEPILEDDPIWTFAGKAGISQEMIGVAWSEFLSRFRGSSNKVQVDWRAHFRNAVRGNWYNIWVFKEGKEAFWTTTGEGLRRAAA